MSTDHWDERVTIGRRTDWFWDPLGSQHMARYLWARSIVGTGDILDVACGTGYGSALMAGPGRRVMGIDLSAEAIDRATHNFSLPGVSFVVGDATNLPVATSSLDFVVSFETIEHLPQPAVFLAEIGRVLRPKGTLLLSTPDRAVYSRGRTDGRSHNPFHPSEMTRQELLASVGPLFKVRHVLGQGARPESGTHHTTPASRLIGTSRRVAKRAAAVGLTPVIRSDAIARLLFPVLRHHHMPVRSDLGEFLYILIVAEKR